MKIINKKSILTIFSILILVFLLGYLWFFILNHLISIKNENFRLAGELELANKKIKKNKELEELHKNLNDEKSIAENILLNKENFINLIEKLEFLSKNTGTELNINSAIMPQTQGEYPVLNFEIKGNFNTIFKFIKLTENLPYILSFEKITLQKDSLENAEFPWTTDISLKILSYR